MKSSANILMVEHIIEFFKNKGFDVKIRDGKKVAIAILGSGNNSVSFFETERLFGVEQIIRDNKLFVSNPDDFVEDWEWSKRRELDKSLPLIKS
jgi:hypothetical protein